MGSTDDVSAGGIGDRSRSGRRKVEYTSTIEDVIVEILLRLPVKSLVQFKPVCKEWYKLINSPNFIAMHLTHMKGKKKASLLSCLTTPTLVPVLTTDVLFQFDGAPMELTIPEFVDSVSIVGCFNGVVCLSLSSGRAIKFALWNPATRVFREIGSMVGGPRHQLWRGGSGFGFSLDAMGVHFKVALITCLYDENVTQKQYSAQVEMFSSSSNSWNEKKIDVPCPIGERTGPITIARAYCLNWNMYWYIYVKQRGIPTELKERYILCFDMMDELFKRIEMPGHPINKYVRLAGYKESLAMFAQQQANIDVWVMNDCSGSEPSWSKLLTCRPSINSNYPLGFFTKDGADSVVFKALDGFLYLYGIETGEINKLWEAKVVHAIFQYSESLASLK